MASPSFHKFRFAVEFCTLFFGVPVAYTLGWMPITIMPLLLVMAALCWLALNRLHQIAVMDLLKTRVAPGEWRRILSVNVAAIPVLIILLWLLRPAALFGLVLGHPKIWLLVMFAYPILSVFPQELIYRAFLFKRYHPLFGHGFGMIVASAAAFGFGHIVFHNWPAVALTFIGGLLFARTYQRTSSLIAVAAEHALYGCTVFTIGYGAYFYEGTLRLLRQ